MMKENQGEMSENSLENSQQKLSAFMSDVNEEFSRLCHSVISVAQFMHFFTMIQTMVYPLLLISWSARHVSMYHVATSKAEYFD